MRADAIASPMPREPPVTIATWPSREFAMNRLYDRHLALSCEIPRPRFHRRPTMLHAHLQAMPAAGRHALRRVADEVAHAELLENSRERRGEILRRFDREKPAARHFAQVTQETDAVLADFDAIHHHVA